MRVAWPRSPVREKGPHPHRHSDLTHTGHHLRHVNATRCYPWANAEVGTIISPQLASNGHTGPENQVISHTCGRPDAVQLHTLKLFETAAGSLPLSRLHYQRSSAAVGAHSIGPGGTYSVSPAPPLAVPLEEMPRAGRPSWRPKPGQQADIYISLPSAGDSRPAETRGIPVDEEPSPQPGQPRPSLRTTSVLEREGQHAGQWSSRLPRTHLGTPVYMAPNTLGAIGINALPRETISYAFPREMGAAGPSLRIKS